MTPKQKLKKANLDWEYVDKFNILIKTRTFNIDYNLINGKWIIGANNTKGQSVDKLLDFISRYKGKRLI